MTLADLVEHTHRVVVDAALPWHRPTTTGDTATWRVGTRTLTARLYAPDVEVWRRQDGRGAPYVSTESLGAHWAWLTGDSR